jgi:hypothetical protein
LHLIFILFFETMLEPDINGFVDDLNEMTQMVARPMMI